jgi:hypothetical protein
LLGGRAAGHGKFGAFKTLIEFRLQQATAKITELEKELEEMEKRKKALEDLDLKNLSVPEMYAFLDSRKANEIALPEVAGEDEELAEEAEKEGGAARVKEEMEIDVDLRA